jgi:hypothetical protein
VSRLRIDWCTTDAARFACGRWHYTGSTHPIKPVQVGVWWDGKFAGVVVFARPARNQHVMFGLRPEQVCELARVALDRHEGFHVTEVVAQALRMLKQRCPKLRLVVSFADPVQGHVGRIYQAGNWIYSGTSASARVLVHQGKRLHRRYFTGSTFGNPAPKPPKGSVWVPVPGKHRYLMPLDRRMRRQIERIRKPYPQHADAQVEGAEHQLGEAVQARPSASEEPRES